MALNLSTVTKPVSNQVVDPATGVMRQEWIDFFGDLTGQLNSAVGELGNDKAPADASYIVGAANAALTAERVATNSTSNTWNLATPGQAAVERAALSGDVTASANSNAVTVNSVAGFGFGASGNRWGVLPQIGTDGVMEVGRILDFHNSDADTADNNGRLRADDIGTAGQDLSWTPGAGADSGVLKRFVTAINSTLAHGDLLYYNAANFVRLAPGTSGQLLRTNGAAAPSWDYPGKTLLATGSAAAAASLDIVLTSFTGFRHLEIVLQELIPATDDTQLLMRTSTNGGSSYDAGATDYGYSTLVVNDTAGTANTGSNGAASIGITSASGTNKLSSDAGASANFVLELLNRTLTRKCLVQWRGGWVNTFPGSDSVIGSGWRSASADVDAVRFLMASGNITSVNYAVYGWS